ncbi:MAG: tyrosine-type recombinase/integrase [Candidatus Hydrogenedentota bacterium]
MTKGGARVARRGAKRIYADWLEVFDDETQKRYDYAWRSFADYLGFQQGWQAFGHLLRISPGEANVHAERYKAWLDRRGLAANTINLRVSALRSLMREAQKLGKGHGLVVHGYPVKPFRDVAGPGLAALKVVLFTLEQGEDAGSLRDAAMIRLMFERGLRRSEVARLRLEDVRFKPPPPGIWILGKKRKQHEYCNLPKGSLRTMKEWMTMRGTWKGPLFCKLGLHGELCDEVLDGQAIYYIVRRRFANIAGVRATPHGIRHTGATAAFELSGGNVDQVRQWGRWGKLETAQGYNDAVNDQGGVLGEELSDLASAFEFDMEDEPERRRGHGEEEGNG